MIVLCDMQDTSTLKVLLNLILLYTAQHKLIIHTYIYSCMHACMHDKKDHNSNNNYYYYYYYCSPLAMQNTVLTAKCIAIAHMMKNVRHIVCLCAFRNKFFKMFPCSTNI